MKLDRLVALEKRLARLLDRRLREPSARHDILELVPLILDHVEEHVVPAPGGGRTFPYDAIRVQIAVPPSEAPAARAVLEHPPGLGARVLARLRETGCALPADPKVAARVIEGGKPESWGDLPFHIEYREKRQRKQQAPAAAPAAPARIRLVVLAGAAGPRTQEFDQERVNVGRMRRVEARAHGSVRHNHLAFEDDGSEVNSTVSRAHAHLRREGGAVLLFDEGSAHGTRVLRAGRSISVPRQGNTGVRLEEGDELEFGSARVRFLMARERVPERDPSRKARTES